MISEDERIQFHEWGYVVLPHFFDEIQNKAIVEALLATTIAQPNSKALLPNPVFERLFCGTPFLTIARAVLGGQFLFHHANGRAMPAASVGKHWHHDFDGPSPWSSGSPMMIHLMGYPDGLDEERGPLVVLPASHKRCVAREYPHVYGLESIEGARTLVGEAGALVVINSALWHMTGPSRSQRVRYYFNFSYCQYGVARPEREIYSSILERLRMGPSDSDRDVREMLLHPDTVIPPATKPR
ncbi:MAG: phytanoyl-CoA dioxygenase family protein [Acidobacteriota bacterium]